MKSQGLRLEVSPSAPTTDICETRLEVDATMTDEPTPPVRKPQALHSSSPPTVRAEADQPTMQPLITASTNPAAACCAVK